MKFLFWLSFLIVIITTECVAKEPSSKNKKLPKYNIYFGNTHSHSNYSGDRIKSLIQHSPENSPSNLFKLAKENGYQFYAVTDHSQYSIYTSDAFADVKVQALKYTATDFIGIRGFEHSENNGPDGKGHMNVYNSNNYLNALADSVDLQYFQKWLAKKENENVVVCFNHPKIDDFNDFYCYDKAALKHISLIELINRNNTYYPAFVNALLKGWKVSPVAGCDNHEYPEIAKWEARTGVVATELTYEGIMEALAAGRTYATFDKNLEIMYYVNNKPMGSVIYKKKKLHFSIEISDSDTLNPEDIISKVEIVGGSKVVETKKFTEHTVEWDIELNAEDDYYYLIVYDASSKEPVAYTAPVWIK